MKKALSKMMEINRIIDERRGKTENFRKIVEIHTKINPKVNGLVEPSRVFINEGNLKYSVNKKFDDSYFFLFNDLLLITKPPTKGNYLII